MIESITLVNFQKHGELTVELDPLVTVLVGGTDHGKSSVIRAFFWITANRPSGRSFLTHGREYCQVLLRLDGGILVRRMLGSNNIYRIGNQVLRSFGTNVPVPIQSLLNLDEVNFQFQHDPPFWLSLSPGEVSRQLNQVVNLGLIDSTLSNLASEQRRAKAEVDVTENRLQGARKKKEELSWVKECDQDLKRLEELRGRKDDLTNRTRTIQTLLEESGRCRQFLEKNEEVQVSFKELESVVQAAREGMQRVYRFRSLVEEYDKCRVTLEKSKSELARARQELKKSLQGRCPLCHQEWSPSS